MLPEALKPIFGAGETIAVEFKRCGNGIESDTYETVCSFLNRFGGDIFLGVEDNGAVCGIPENAAEGMVKNFIAMTNNPDIISPTVYLTPEILQCGGKTIIRIQILPSSEVHSYKRVIYDRNNDSDVKVTATGQIAQMYIRKQKIYTEQKVYPYLRPEHFRLDLLPRIRQMAINRHLDHPWKNLSDLEILKSAKLYSEDYETGKWGYNLAAVMLLGRDEVIKDVSPVYRTDALFRKVNIDRYDDRRIVETNLIESHKQLLEFAAKHLLDKFYLEDDARISLAGIIAREMLANSLIHREFTSSHIAQFVIEKNQMTVSNANRSDGKGIITPENLSPNPKNPIIAAFFRNIGLADDLGSGTRRLYKYVPRYSGRPPQLIDGDVFKIIVPLDDNYSFDASIGNDKLYSAKAGGINGALRNKIVALMKTTPSISTKQIAESLGIDTRNAESNIRALKKAGVVKREGAKKNGVWVVQAGD